MARNEKTSARVAKIAGKILAVEAPTLGIVHLIFARNGVVKHATPDVSWRDIRALAASALTQAPDSKSTRKRVTSPARIKSKRPSSWPPSAKPKRRSP